MSNTPYMYTLHTHLYNVITLYSQVLIVITLCKSTQCHNTTFIIYSVMHTVHSAITFNAQCTQFYNTQCCNTPYMYTLQTHLYNVIILHSQVDSVITLQ